MENFGTWKVLFPLGEEQWVCLYAPQRQEKGHRVLSSIPAEFQRADLLAVANSHDWCFYDMFASILMS
jgi:hypothetical protein